MENLEKILDFRFEHIKSVSPPPPPNLTQNFAEILLTR